jgi:hypothetical protein
VYSLIIESKGKGLSRIKNITISPIVLTV